MTKLEKTIRGLECCIKRDPDDYLRCDACPYPDGSACANRLKIDALELLKEQEPVEPKKSRLSMNNGFMWDIYDCGFCGSQLRGFAKYCDQCGKAVKWE